jgi:hypothetical protein
MDILKSEHCLAITSWPDFAGARQQANPWVKNDG